MEFYFFVGVITCRHLRAVQVHPGLTSWVILSRPCGTDPCCHLNPGLRPGLLSAVPTGLIAVGMYTQDCAEFPARWSRRARETADPSGSHANSEAERYGLPV
jgi:hypothetical protein